MKEKLVKSVSIVLAMGTILGLGLSINKSYATQANRLQNGQPDLDSYGYNVNAPAEYEIKDDPGASRWHLADIPGFQVYCIQPNSALKYNWDREWDDIMSHPPHNQTRSGCGASASCSYDGDISPIHIFNRGISDLSPAAAYIVSEDPVGQWTEDKQRALWNLRDKGDITANDGCTLDLDEGLIIGSGSITHPGSSYIDDEAEKYALYHHDIEHKTDIDPLTGQLQEEGIAPVDQATGQGTVSYLQNTDEYAVKYFSVDYVNGDYGSVTFAGISDIYVIGYNAKGEPVKDANGDVKRIDIERINILQSDGKTLDRTILASQLEFFEPEDENVTTGQKTDHTTQNYPKPGEKFEVVYKNPNVGIDYNDEENRVVTVTVKVKFKYMRAQGKYALLELEKKQIQLVHNYSNYYSHGSKRKGTYHSGHHRDTAYCKINTINQQYHMAADAIRAIYEDEIDLVPGGDGDGLTDMTMQIGGRVWMDAAIGKEGMQCDGQYIQASAQVNPDDLDFSNDVDTLLKGVEVQLFEQVNGALNPDPVAYTVTDDEGKYIFYGLDIAKKYTLKFVYNGLMYQPTSYTKYLRGDRSNITENATDRDNFNTNFAEIAAYPNNYQVRVALFKNVGEYNQSWSIEELTEDDNSLYYQWVNRAYEIVEQSRTTDKYAVIKDGNDPVSAFVLAARELGTTDELRSQLQFLMDCRMEAWTGNNSNATETSGLVFYPEVPAGFEGVTPRSREEADEPSTGTFYTAEGYKTIAIYDGVRKVSDDSYTIQIETVDKNGNKITIPKTFVRITYEDDRSITPDQLKIDSVLRIDGGLSWRYQFDLALKKDVYKATLKINGKTQVYTYNSRNLSLGDADLEGNQTASVNGKTQKDTTWDIEIRKEQNYYGSTSYQRDLYKTDYYYKSTDYSNNRNTNQDGNDITQDLLDLKEGTELEIYVTYKIAVRNQSQSIMGAVTEIVDYYDETYTFEPNLSFATYIDGLANGNSDYAEEDTGTIFASNKVDDDEFYEAMAQEFEIRGDQTYYEENRNSTILDYVTTAKSVTGDANSIYANRNGSQKDLSGYQELYVTGLDGKQLDTGESLYVYLTFRVNRDGDYLDVADEKENTAEINGYRTFYKDGTVLTNYDGQNNYTVSGTDTVAGLIDKDSTPGSITQNEIGNPDLFEDDTDQAPTIRFVVQDEDQRVLNGVVWEDERNENSGDAVIGNGRKDNGEENVQGVTVQFIEIIQPEKDGTDYYESIWKEVKTTSNGYEFVEYIPGNYYVKFIYGDGRETVLASEDLFRDPNEVTALVGGNALNKNSYNGQDYKSTTYQLNVDQSEGAYTMPTPFVRGEQVNGYEDYGPTDGTYGGAQNEIATFIYDIGVMDENPDLSDAKDIGSMRDRVINYSKNNVRNHVAEVLVSPYEIPTYNGTAYTVDEQNALIDELIANTAMNAISGVIDMEVEYNRTQSDGPSPENGEYTLAGLDLGLEERPEAQLVVNKKVYEFDVRDSTGTPLFNSQNLSPVANLVWLANQENTVTKENGLLTRYDFGQLGLLQPSVDEENMRGMVVTITYQISIKNEGEVDYIESQFYYTGAGGSSQSQTQVNNMLDYVDLNLRFVSENQNGSWRIVEGSQNANNYTAALTGTGILNQKLAENVDNDYEQIIQLSQALEATVPGGENILTLVLSQTITAEDLESSNIQDVLNGNTDVIDADGKLVFNNLTELVETSNTLGRRMAFSVVGNQEPRGDLKEIDAAKAEEIILMGPYGTTRPTLYAVLGITICAIIIAGVVVIKKKILK